MHPTALFLYPWNSKISEFSFGSLKFQSNGLILPYEPCIGERVPSGRVRVTSNGSRRVGGTECRRLNLDLGGDR